MNSVFGDEEGAERGVHCEVDVRDELTGLKTLKELEPRIVLHIGMAYWLFIQ